MHQREGTRLGMDYVYRLIDFDQSFYLTIAYDLGISPRTVEIYRANVMTKMKAASLSELVRMALVAGMLGAKT